MTESCEWNTRRLYSSAEVLVYSDFDMGLRPSAAKEHRSINRVPVNYGGTMKHSLCLLTIPLVAAVFCPLHAEPLRMESHRHRDPSGHVLPLRKFGGAAFHDNRKQAEVPLRLTPGRVRGEQTAVVNPRQHVIESQMLCDSVKVAWRTNYSDGLQTSEDIGQAVTTDASGNVYVTGASLSGTSDDYATVKYNSSGVQQWVARYDGPAHTIDKAIALAVDASGNVYVTGFSEGIGSGGDYATVKYDSSGVQQWVGRYDGPGHGDDDAVALAVDASDNVYVTGFSLGLANNDDYATVKYNSSGAQQWVARYDGAANDEDIATALAVDASGNVYVTGYSLGTSNDYATVMYNSSGVQQWVARYDGPANYDDAAYALALDASGNVFVTGYSVTSGTNYDFATVKYNSSGAQQWVARYDGPANGTDQPYALALDAYGNVYVTGMSFGSWPNADYATLKYSSSGVQQWVNRYHGPRISDDEAYALALDASGNVYVTGSSVGSDTIYDYATVKYSSSGVQQWVARYDGPGNSGATSVAVDASGSVCVTGSSVAAQGYQYTTIKYTQSTFSGYGYPRRWNLVSLPKRVSDSSAAAVFAPCSSPLFEYNTAYSARASLEIGKGYWLKLPWDECVSIAGDTVLVDTIDVVEGWNLIGSLTLPIAVGSVASDPVGMITSSFFGYAGNYATSSTIEPGMGYWVKVNQSGKLILSSKGATLPSARIIIVATSEQPPPPPEAEQTSTQREIPKEYALHQNYPNPFNPVTTIRFSVPASGSVSLKAYNVLGLEIAVLIDEQKGPGDYLVSWDAGRFPSGVYFYRMTAGSFSETKKLLLLR